MAAPPVPPRPMSARPDYFQDEFPGQQHAPRRESMAAPAVPPLPPNYPRADTLSPHWHDPMPAPRPQKIMSNVPDDMAQSLEQSMQQPSGFSMPVPSFAGGFAMPPPPPSAQGPAYGFRQPTMAPQRPLSTAYPGPGGFSTPQPPPQPHHQPTLQLAQSFDAMSLNSPQLPGYAPRQSSLYSPATPRPLSYAGSSNAPPTPAPLPPSSPPPNFDEPAPTPGGAPAIVAPMPSVSTLLAAESRITKPSHLVAWSKAVLALVDRLQPDADPTRPESISDPVLARLANVAVQHVTSFASIWQIGSPGPVPAHVAEALYLRGTLEASGAFPEKIPRDQRAAFRDFEAAARQGYAPGWFKLGRDYESVKDIAHAKEVFERGARAKETSSLYRLGMAHLLGQLGLPATPAIAVPLLREAADLSSIDVPQPSYVFGMLLLGEFVQVALPPDLLARTLPAQTPANPHPRASEARRRIERAAFLGFGPALYKMGWAYEHAKMGCTYDPLLSVQYYSSASQRGEGEADMALSKWFLCGSEGGFDKDEHLAVVFAEKAANRRLASGMFAMGYYNEVGVGVKADRGEAIKWYTKAAAEGNTEAVGRLTALAAPNAAPLSRAEHETLTDSRLVRKHTRAKDTAVAAGRVAQVKGDEERKAMTGAAHAAAADPNAGRPPTANANPGTPTNANANPSRRPGQMALPGGRVASPPRGQSPMHQSGTSPQRRPGGTSPQHPMSGAGRGGGVRPQQQRYTLTDDGFQSPSTPTQHNPHSAPAPSTPAPAPAPVPTLAPAPTPASAPATPAPTTPSSASGRPPKKGPQTFAEMGFQPTAQDDKECVIM